MGIPAKSKTALPPLPSFASWIITKLTLPCCPHTGREDWCPTAPIPCPIWCAPRVAIEGFHISGTGKGITPVEHRRFARSCRESRGCARLQPAEGTCPTERNGRGGCDSDIRTGGSNVDRSSCSPSMAPRARLQPSWCTPARSKSSVSKPGRQGPYRLIAGFPHIEPECHDWRPCSPPSVRGGRIETRCRDAPPGGPRAG